MRHDDCGADVPSRLLHRGRCACCVALRRKTQRGRARASSAWRPACSSRDRSTPSPMWPASRVGHTTLNQGDDVRTGVTVVVPHRRQRLSGQGAGRRVRRQRVRQARRIDAGRRARHDRNADRADQHAERRRGRWKASCAGRSISPATTNVRSVNALVGETNDGGLNDIRGQHVRPAARDRGIEGREHRRRCKRAASAPARARRRSAGRAASAPRRANSTRATAATRVGVLVQIELRRRADDGRRAGREDARAVCVSAAAKRPRPAGRCTATAPA